MLAQPVKTPQPVDAHRRSFLRNAAAVSLVSAFAGGSLLAPLVANAQSVPLPPVRARGTALLNVKNFGAVGDGVKDDTAAIQAALNKLGTLGGTVVIPAGRYLIDAAKNLRPLSRTLLKLEPGAVLVAKPNALSRSYVIYLKDKVDVEIQGGEIIGERDRHDFSRVSGTHEWGHGIQVLGCKRVTISDIRISNCTGDGICLGGMSDDVVVSKAICDNNRRQGLSITNTTNVKVLGGEYINTNGTAPQCGIDIEPDDPYSNSKTLIQGARLAGNKVYGLLIWNRVSDVTVTGCTIEKNNSNGVTTHGCSGIKFTGNTVRYNSATGLRIDDGTSNIVVSGNTFYGNYARQGIKTRTQFTQTGWSSKVERDMLIRGTTSAVQILSNTYK